MGDMVWTVDVVVPGGGRGKTQVMVHRGREVVGTLRIARGIAPPGVGTADYIASPAASPGEEDRLHSPPVIGPRGILRLGQQRDLGESGFAPRFFLPCGCFVLVTPETYLTLPLRMAKRLSIG